MPPRAQISAHMAGTRDERAVSSHAQKHFIRLCLQGRQLPAKVAESGDGYTLSGKPLDPNSSAARQYGFKPDTLQARTAPARPCGRTAKTSCFVSCFLPLWDDSRPLQRSNALTTGRASLQKLEETFGADVLGGLAAETDPADGEGRLFFPVCHIRHASERAYRACTHGRGRRSSAI